MLLGGALEPRAAHNSSPLQAQQQQQQGGSLGQMPDGSCDAPAVDAMMHMGPSELQHILSGNSSALQLPPSAIDPQLAGIIQHQQALLEQAAPGQLGVSQGMLGSGAAMAAAGSHPGSTFCADSQMQLQLVQQRGAAGAAPVSSLRPRSNPSANHHMMQQLMMLQQQQLMQQQQNLAGAAGITGQQAFQLYGSSYPPGARTAPSAAAAPMRGALGSGMSPAAAAAALAAAGGGRQQSASLSHMYSQAAEQQRSALAASAALRAHASGPCSGFPVGLGGAGGAGGGVVPGAASSAGEGVARQLQFPFLFIWS
jgi:hypothetical protein